MLLRTIDLLSTALGLPYDETKVLLISVVNYVPGNDEPSALDGTVVELDADYALAPPATAPPRASLPATPWRAEASSSST